MTIPAPSGTRTVLRDARVEAAILETARGGILRRGLAAERAQVAVITNISSDHFGEYGVHDLAGLADVKLVVASVVDDNGLLVLNADDPILLARAQELDCPIGWFSRDYDHPTLQAHRAMRRLDERRPRRPTHRQQKAGRTGSGRDRRHATDRRGQC